MALADKTPRINARSGFDLRGFPRAMGDIMRDDVAAIPALCDALPSVSEYQACLIFGSVADWISDNWSWVAFNIASSDQRASFPTNERTAGSQTVFFFFLFFY